MSVITSTPGQLQVIKRNGEVATFDAEKFLLRLEKHFWLLKVSRVPTQVAFMTESVS